VLVLHVNLDTGYPIEIVTQVLPVVALVFASIALLAGGYDVAEPMFAELASVYRNTVIHLIGIALAAVGAPVLEVGFRFLPVPFSN
jgi:hypothetical protein